MVHRSIRWMTRDFVFTAPSGFPDVVATDLQRFELFAYPRGTDNSSIFVAVIDREEPWDLDDSFAVTAAGLLGTESAADWSVSPVQVFGREARYGTSGDVLGITLARGRMNRVWAFGWRSAAGNRTFVEGNYHLMMRGLQTRTDETSDTILKSQFHRQAKTRELMIAGVEAARQIAVIDLQAEDGAWDRRFAHALGESGTAAMAEFFAKSISLMEEPFGEEAPLGVSRIGGGPDLPSDPAYGAWPENERGMRHPFLLQIDLAEVASACGSIDPLPADGLLSFFVHDDALLLDVVYTPAGVALMRHPMTEAIIEASEAAVSLLEDLGEDMPAGRLPHTEGDLITAELMPDGMLKFAHTSDPVWAVGEPGVAFKALSDGRWASAAYARLKPIPSRSFDYAGAQMRIGEAGHGSADDLVETYEDFERAITGPHAGAGTPQLHQMLGYATIQGGRDCRGEAAGSAEHDLNDPKDWMVLVRLRAGSATGMIFWDADDLVILAPIADVAVRRWDRCVLLAG